MLAGLMQDHPLVIPAIIDHAARWHGGTEIVGRTPGNGRERTGYAGLRLSAMRTARALVEALDVRPGDRVATLAWNSLPHLELFYAVSGIGAVLHTVNPRLFDDQVRYIMAHAEDVAVFVDPDFAPIVERLWRSLPSVRHWVWLGDVPPAGADLPPATAYHPLREAHAPLERWPAIDERAAAALCYTSGTTGNPKGVLYSHRSTVLHAMVAAQPDAFNMSATDTLLAVANMYHASAWATPYVVPMVGARLVLPGSQPTAETFLELMVEERATFATGVPTIWTMLLAEAEKRDERLPHLRQLLCGGSAMPPVLAGRLRERFGCTVVQLWGMTETSPFGTAARPTAALDALPDAQRCDLLSRQGRPAFGVDLKVTGEDGAELPHDGRSAGALWVRGPWVCAGYFGNDGPVLDAEGWFPTGDVASIDPHGFLSITDRTKDVIKSGGEWVSSVELENHICAMPEVAMAAVIGVRHPKWEERPLALVVLREGHESTREAVLAHLSRHLARWQLPEDVLFLGALPLTATGKIWKLKLREIYAERFTGRAGA